MLRGQPHVADDLVARASFFSSLLISSFLFFSSDKELLGPEVVTTLHFLQSFVRLAQLPLNVLEQRIPNMILSEFEYLATPLK